MIMMGDGARVAAREDYAMIDVRGSFLKKEKDGAFTGGDPPTGKDLLVNCYTLRALNCFRCMARTLVMDLES